MGAADLAVGEGGALLELPHREAPRVQLLLDGGEGDPPHRVDGALRGGDAVGGHVLSVAETPLKPEEVRDGGYGLLGLRGQGAAPLGGGEGGMAAAAGGGEREGQGWRAWEASAKQHARCSGRGGQAGIRGLPIPPGCGALPLTSSSTLRLLHC